LLFILNHSAACAPNLARLCLRRFLNEWDKACLAADNQYSFISSPWQWATMVDDEKQVIVAERGPLVWVFNFSPFNTYEGLQVGRCACRPIVLVRSAAPTRALPPQLLPAAALPFSARGGSHTPTPAPPLPPFPRQIPVPEPGKYRVALDSDAWDFGGPGRVGHDVDHFTVVRLPHLGGRRACQPPTPRVCQLCYRERRGCSRCISSGRGPACSCHP
jgi:hypothetical protein